jgi:hypothetical protein
MQQQLQPAPLSTRAGRSWALQPPVLDPRAEARRWLRSDAGRLPAARAMRSRVLWLGPSARWRRPHRDAEEMMVQAETRLDQRREQQQQTQLEQTTGASGAWEQQTCSWQQQQRRRASAAAAATAAATSRMRSHVVCMERPQTHTADADTK